MVKTLKPSLQGYLILLWVYSNSLQSTLYSLIHSPLPLPQTDIKIKMQIATELRDTVDTYSRDMDPAKFFDILLPCFIEILKTGKPSLINNSPDNRFRQLLLQILHRLPHVEPLRIHTGPLMQLLLLLLRIENEDNAVLCLKIVIDLHRTYSRPPALDPTTSNSTATPPPPASTSTLPLEPTPVEKSVDEFLEIVRELFQGMKAVVEETFSSAPSSSIEQPAPSPGPGPGALVEIDPGGVGGVTIHLAPAMKSFKLLQDTPAAIVFIFQTYRNLVSKAISVFVPLVFEVRFFFLSTSSIPLFPFILLDRLTYGWVGGGKFSSSNFKRHHNKGSMNQWNQEHLG